MKKIVFNYFLDTGEGDYYLLDADTEEAAKAMITDMEDFWGYDFSNAKLVDEPENISAIYNALTKNDYASLGYNTKDELFNAYESDPELTDNTAYSIDGVEGAVIGISEDGSRFIYDFDKLLACLQTNDDMTPEEAMEWYSYNIERSFPYYQPCPIIVQKLDV